MLAVEEKVCLAETHPLSILVAEDNLVNQKIAIGIFKKLGYTIDIANNGLEAVQAVKRQPYNIVFMDVQMPEMDGLEASRRINDQWGSKKPWIVALTANALKGDREMCLEAGMDDYLTKPFRLADIEALLMERMSHITK